LYNPFMGNCSDYDQPISKMAVAELTEINQCRKELGMPLLELEIRQRKCLKCDSPFPTEYRYNFLCYACNYALGRTKGSW
jgi:hypothetical protein